MPKITPKYQDWAPLSTLRSNKHPSFVSFTVSVYGLCPYSASAGTIRLYWTELWLIGKKNGHNMAVFQETDLLLNVLGYPLLVVHNSTILSNTKSLKCVLNF